MGTSISAGTIMAYMDLDMSSFNSAIDMAGEQLSGFASGGVAGALGSIGAAAETAGRALTMHITGKLQPESAFWQSKKVFGNDRLASVISKNLGKKKLTEHPLRQCVSPSADESSPPPRRCSSRSACPSAFSAAPVCQSPARAFPVPVES